MIIAAGVLGMAAPFLRPGESPLLLNIFVFIPGVFGIMFASLWLLASDIFETTPKPQAARAFGKIGASSLAGGMAGGFIAKWVGPLVEPKWLIFIGALMILAVVALVLQTHRQFPSNLAPNERHREAA